MRNLVLILSGPAMLAVFHLIGRVAAGGSIRPTALSAAFLLLWLAVTVCNLIGGLRHGYGFAEELPADAASPILETSYAQLFRDARRPHVNQAHGRLHLRPVDRAYHRLLTFAQMRTVILRPRQCVAIGGGLADVEIDV